MADGHVDVAVIGMGDIGRGWAALIAAAGWKVVLYDADQARLAGAAGEIVQRARALGELRGADPHAIDQGLAKLTTARSLLLACEEAEWVIECIHEDLIAKQKLFESIESVAPRARAITSSTSMLPPHDIAARMRDQEKCLVTHPLNPPELIPLVELVPHRGTDRALLELMRAWMKALGKIPVTIRKPVRGNVAGRIAAAVWREAIDLVLSGTIDVEDLDRAVSVGPALGWAAAGPHLTYHLAAGQGGVSGFLQGLLAGFEATWEDLADWPTLDLDKQQKLIHMIERAYDDDIDMIRTARDRRLAAILKGIESARSSER